MPPPSVVLLVQPHDDSREMYTSILQHDRMAVVALPSADNAIETAARADVIVVDLDVELIARLRRAQPAKPIVVLTASAFPADRAHAEEAGCSGFLPLPCLPDELLREVRRLLALTRLRTPNLARAGHPASRRNRRTA